MRGAWVFASRDTSHGRRSDWQPNQFILISDLFVLSGFPNCSNVTVSFFFFPAVSRRKHKYGPRSDVQFLFYHHFICPTNENLLILPPGDRCEFDRRQGRCVPGVCRNGGTCQELSGGGFRCDCPAGGYERPYCTVTARSFPPKSFAMFRGLRQRFHLTISLT